MTGTDAEVAGDVVEYAHGQKLTGHQGEGTYGDRENRQPLLFDTLLIMFRGAVGGLADAWHGGGFHRGMSLEIKRCTGRKSGGDYRNRFG